MAFLNICGWETGDFGEFEFTQGTVSVQSTTKRTGTYACRVNPTAGSGSCSIRTVDAAGGLAIFASTKLWVTCYVWFATLPVVTASSIFRTHPQFSNSACIEVRVDASGNIYLHNGTTASANAATLSTGVWYRVEFTSQQSATCELKVDGGSAVTLTAANQDDAQLSVGARDGTFTFDAYFDDLAVKDDAYAGDGDVRLLSPDGNGTYTAWSTGTGASDYLEVDETPHDSDTTYIGSSTSGQVETVTLISSAAAGLQDVIDCVKAMMIARRTGASNNNAQLRLRSGSTDTDTTSADSTTTYALRARLFETDPATSAAWTSGGVDSVQVGIEINASQASRCTWVGATVWSRTAPHTPDQLGRPFGLRGQRQMSQLIVQ